MALFSKLDLVNQMLVAVGLRPAAILDTGNTSPASDAERILDWETKAAQCEGFYGNKVMAKAYTPSGGLVTLASTVLAIKAAGRTQSRNFDIRNNGGNLQVYDLDAESFTIVADASTGMIFLDVIFEVPIANLAPYIQVAILKRAQQVFQRRFKGDPEKDANLGEERLRADALGDRSSGRSEGDRSNPPAMNPQAQRGRGAITPQM